MTSINYMQVVGGICFAHGPYTEWACPKYQEWLSQPAQDRKGFPCTDDPQQEEFKFMAQKRRDRQELIKRDTERLDWLDTQGDIGIIRIDPDLEGQPVIKWNHWRSVDYPTNVREAIDKAIEKVKEQDERINQMENKLLSNVYKRKYTSKYLCGNEE